MKKSGFYLGLLLLLCGNTAMAVEMSHRDEIEQRIDQRRRATDLGHNYTMDKFGVYYNDGEMKEADRRTFQVLDYGYARDKWNVFYKGRALKEANARSFHITDQVGVAKDNRNTFKFGQLVSRSNSRDYIILDDFYAKDRFDVYFDGQKIVDA